MADRIEDRSVSASTAARSVTSVSIPGTSAPRLTEARPFDVSQHQLRALRGERTRGGKADTAGVADNHGNLIPERLRGKDSPTAYDVKCPSILHRGWVGGLGEVNLEKRISIDVTDGVADVRLNRPDKMNAIDVAMFEALSETSAALNAMPHVRVVVLSGEGKSFCAGIDLTVLRRGSALVDLSARTHGEANLFQNAVWGWRTLRVPVIAAVHGSAFGGGFQIMLGADIRILAPDATLSVMEVRWGIVPDMGGTALLRHLIRDDIARELTYTGRQLDGEEAARLGLATRLADDPRAEALALARRIAAASPLAIRGAKRLFNHAADGDAPAQLLAEAQVQQPLLAAADIREAMAAATEKRLPLFADPV